jgi:hypothetical protein
MLWPREESFTTVANVRAYALNPALGRLNDLWDVAHGIFLPTVPRRQWDSLGVNRTVTATQPMGWYFGNVWPVAVQPRSSTVTIVSDSSADLGTVQLLGIDSSGNALRENINLSGITPVTSTNTYDYLIKVTKSGATWTGLLTFTDANANTLLTLKAGIYGKTYPTIEFIESPQGGLVYTYTFNRNPSLLGDNNDIPDIWPNDCSEILVYDCLIDMATYNTELGQKEIVTWQKRYDELYKQMLIASDEAGMGSYPRFVRDLSGGASSRRIQIL